MSDVPPQTGEHRICPECARWLRFWNEQYLCLHCWVLFTHEHTLPHPHPERLCNFIIRDADAGRHYICLRCTKSYFVRKESLGYFEHLTTLLFCEENVATKRQEHLAMVERIREQIEEQKAKEPTVEDLLRRLAEIKS